MSWVSLILAILKLANYIIDQLERRKIWNQAQQELVRDATEKLNARMVRVAVARERAERDHDAGVVHNDPFNRDLGGPVDPTGM